MPRLHVKLVFDGKEIIQLLPDTFEELEAVAREWSGLSPRVPVTFRVPARPQPDSHTSTLCDIDPLYIDLNKKSYMYIDKFMNGVDVLRVEIMSPTPVAQSRIPRPATMYAAKTPCGYLEEPQHYTSQGGVVARDGQRKPEVLSEVIARPTVSHKLHLSYRARDRIIPQLGQILSDQSLYRALLKAKGPNAQVLLDVFQWLLDEARLDNDLRRRLIVATQRLSTKSGLYPICYELKGIARDGHDPVTGGGFADIYKGLFGQQVVCLKTIRIYQQSQLEHVLKQFSKEVILWGQLSHPNVLPMYGLYYLNKRLCIVTPWMHSGDICGYLRNNAKVDRLLLVFDIARGLLYLHSNDIVHGDLKGPNILIDDDGRARLCDFGIASVCDSQIHGWTTQSPLSSIGGSSRWQAPELFDIDDGDAQNTTFSDVYAFGCVCYEVFTGKLPFYELSRDTAIMYQVQRSKRPSKPAEHDVSWQDWGMTESIWSLMEDCWKTEISERPTAQQVINRLSPLLRRDDSRTISNGGVLSPTHFRRSMGVPPDDTSLASFAKVLRFDN